MKFKIPPQVQTWLDQTSGLIGQEQTRLTNLQNAMTNGLGGVESALGMNAGGDPYVRQMIGTLLAGGTLNAADYPELAKRMGEPTAPQAVADPGAKPAEYKSQFTGKNWGKNDQAKQDASLTAIQDWTQKKAQYDDYQGRLADYNKQKAAYDAAPADNSQFAYYQQQAQNYLDLVNQQKATMPMEQDLLQQISTALSDPTAADRMSSINDRLNAALTGDPETDAKLKGLYDTAQANYAKVQGGDWSINPEVTRSIDDASQAMIGRLYNQLGSGWATSSAGLEALKKFSETSSDIRQQAYRDDLSQALLQLQGTGGQYLGQLQNEQSIIGNAQNSLASEQQRYLQNIMSLLSTYQQSAAGRNSAMGAQTDYLNQLLGYGQNLASTLQNIQQTPYQVSLQDIITNLQNNAQITGKSTVAQQQQSGNTLGSLLGTLGTIGGVAAGSYFGGPFGASLGSQLGGQLGSMLGGNSQGYNMYNGTFGARY